MPLPFKVTGGARVGWTGTSWPLARLSATPEQLTISIRLLGTYSFAPDQVLSVERYVMIPFLGWGIRIHHCNADCPQRVIFWCLGNPDTVLAGIRDAGFLPAASNSSSPERHGLAMRWSAIIIPVVVWNVLFRLGIGPTNGVPPHPGLFMLAPLLFMFALSVGTLKSPILQRLILKPGRSVGEIRPLLRLLAFISAFMLVIFSILFVSGGFANAPNKSPLPATTKPSPAPTNAISSSPIAQPALTAWQLGDKAAAVSSFLPADWTARPLFAADSTLSLNEAQFKELSDAERQAKSTDMMAQLASLKQLAAAVAQAGRDAAAKGDAAQARKDFTSLKKFGAALENPDYMLLVQLVGRGIEKRGNTELSKLGP